MPRRHVWLLFFSTSWSGHATAGGGARHAAHKRAALTGLLENARVAECGGWVERLAQRRGHERLPDWVRPRPARTTQPVTIENVARASSALRAPVTRGRGPALAVGHIYIFPRSGGAKRGEGARACVCARARVCVQGCLGLGTLDAAAEAKCGRARGWGCVCDCRARGGAATGLGATMTPTWPPPALT